MIMISSNFIFDLTNFCVTVFLFLNKLLTLGILFSTAVIAVVAKLLGISPLTSFILALSEALVVKLVISGIFSSIFLILAVGSHADSKVREILTLCHNRYVINN